MSNLIFLLTLPPVYKGLIGMCIAGVAFPVSGVMVLRLNLVPMRYMLMHGVILGGALSLAFTLPFLPTTILANVALVLLMLNLTGQSNQGFGLASAATMVFTMAAASIVMHIWDVPAKDTLQLLWGSPFALGKSDLFGLAAVALLLGLYYTLSFRTVSAIFFDREIAHSLGMRVKLHYTVMVLSIALVIAFAMKLLGALLIDALLILPVLVAGKRSQSLKQLLIFSSVIGLAVSLFGFLLAVITNFPPSGTVALLSALLYLIPAQRQGDKP